jgi:hypothetical protein
MQFTLIRFFEEPFYHRNKMAMLSSDIAIGLLGFLVFIFKMGEFAIEQKQNATEYGVRKLIKFVYLCAGSGLLLILFALYTASPFTTPLWNTLGWEPIDQNVWMAGGMVFLGFSIIASVIVGLVPNRLVKLSKGYLGILLLLGFLGVSVIALLVAGWGLEA